MIKKERTDFFRCAFCVVNAEKLAVAHFSAKVFAHILIKSFRPIFSKGINTCAKHVCRRRRDGSSSGTRSVAARRRGQGRGAIVTLRRGRKLLLAFLFRSFFLAPALPKKKRAEVLAVSDGERQNLRRNRRAGACSRRKHAGVLLRDQKYQKSAKEGFSSSFANLRALARVCRRKYARRHSATTGAKNNPAERKSELCLISKSARAFLEQAPLWKGSCQRS